MGYHETWIEQQHLPDLATTKVEEESNDTEPQVKEGTLAELVENYEKIIILDKLKKNNGNKTKTAKELGLSVRNLYYKLEKYKVEFR
jgi:transcriptional regulator with PAS, ATPase and Fis domain